MSPGVKAALLAVILSVVLYVRDASVSRSIRQQAMDQAKASFGTTDDELFRASGDNDDDDENHDDFGTDDFASTADSGENSHPRPRRSRARRHTDDEFAFEQDYDDEYEGGSDATDNADFADGGEYGAEFGDASGNHRVLIQFDDTQYKTQFDSVRAALEQYFPQLRGNIRPEKYPLPAYQQTIAMVSSFLPMIVIAAVMWGGNFLIGLGVPPHILQSIKDNRMYVVGAMFIFNMFMRPKLTSTGAFEVVYNGAVVFSKLRTGVLPVDHDVQQLIGALKNAGLKSRAF